MKWSELTRSHCCAAAGAGTQESSSNKGMTWRERITGGENLELTRCYHAEARRDGLPGHGIIRPATYLFRNGYKSIEIHQASAFCAGPRSVDTLSCRASLSECGLHEPR